MSVGGTFAPSQTAVEELSTLKLSRGTIVNSTYGTHNHIYMYLFLLTIFGLIYYGPPKNSMLHVG